MSKEISNIFGTLNILSKTSFFILFFLLFWSGKNNLAQSLNWGLSFRAQSGFLVAHRATMAHLIQQHAYGFNAGVVVQTKGNKKWHHDFNFPEMNLAASYISPGNSDILGQSFGIAGGVYLPFFNTNGWRFGTRLNAGLTYMSKRYDVIENPKNNAIGSHLNCMVDLALQVEKQFKQNTIGMGVNATHISNGAVRLPNLGLNIPFLNLYYHTYFSEIEIKKEIPDEKQGLETKKIEFFTQLIGSTKQIYPTGGRNYGVLAFTNFLHINFKPKAVLEAGIEFSYNQSIIDYFEEEYSQKHNLQFGIYSAYILPIHRFHLLAGMGYYLYNPLNPNGMWFHKLGGRFRITDRIWGNIAIKSHWAKADYFEYGLTFRW